MLREGLSLPAGQWPGAGKATSKFDIQNSIFDIILP
jgi:hypothetical protein